MTENIQIINSIKKKYQNPKWFRLFWLSKEVSRVNQSERKWVRENEWKKRIIQAHFAFCSNFTVANSLTLSSGRLVPRLNGNRSFKKPYIINLVRSQNRWIHFWLYHYLMRLLFFAARLFVCLFRDEAAAILFHLWIPFGVAKSVVAFAAWIFICILVMSAFHVILMYLSWVQTILAFTFRTAWKNVSPFWSPELYRIMMLSHGFYMKNHSNL